MIPPVVTLAIRALALMAALTVPVLAPQAAAGTGHPAKLAGVFIGLVHAGAMMSSLVSQLCLLFRAIGLLPVMAPGAVVLDLGHGPVALSSSHLLARTTPSRRIGRSVRMAS